MDTIDVIRKEIAKEKNKNARLPGNVSIPLSHNLSLLHAAVFAHDEDSVQRLLDSFDADPTSLGLYGTALSLAVDEMEQARDGNTDPAVTLKLKRIMDALRKAAAAKEKAAAETPAATKEATDSGTAKADQDGEEKKSDETKLPPSLQNTSSQRQRDLVVGVETSKRAVSNLPAWMSKEEKQASRAKSDAEKPDVAVAAAGAGGPIEHVARAITREVRVSRIPLPMVISHWLPEVKMMQPTKRRICVKYKGQGCPFGSNCHYAHVHEKVGPVLDSPSFTPKQRDLDDFVPKQYVYTLTRSNDSGERFHTAAFCHGNDEIIYYAERGQGSLLSRQGVYWYLTLDHAMQAVQRVVYCVTSPEGIALRKGDHSENDGKRKRADDSDNVAIQSSTSKRQKEERSQSPVPPSIQSTSGGAAAAAAAPGSTLGPSPTNFKLKWNPPPAGNASQPEPAPPTLTAPPSESVSKPSTKSSMASDPILAPAVFASAPTPAHVPSASGTMPPEATAVSELPDLAKNWFESNHRVHPPVGSVINNDAWCRIAMSEMEGEKPEGYKMKTEMNDDTFTFYYTAAYVDPSDNFVYYSEQGGTLNPTTGVWWYDSEEAAKLAVRKVVAAAQKTKRDAAPVFEENKGMGEEEEKPAIIDASKPAVNDDSSLSNMSIDEEDDSDPALGLRPPSKVVDELPLLDSCDWVKGKSVRCKYFNTTKGCNRVKSCDFAHVQSPIYPASLAKADATKFAQFSTDYIHQKEALTKGFELYYTAAYLDPDENIIYYSQGGNAVGVNAQGIWWYSEEEDAIDAVKRVVVAAASQRASKKASAATVTSSSRSNSSLSQNEVMRRLGNVPNHNLQPVLQKIFRSVRLRRECWRIRHSADGFSVRFLPPRETKTNISVVHPNWRAGKTRDGVWWYRDERTAKNAAFMRFLELCADRGYLKDTAHKLDGTALF